MGLEDGRSASAASSRPHRSRNPSGELPAPAAPAGPSSSNGGAALTAGGAASSSYERIGLKFRGLNDDAHRCNAEAREAIGVLADMFDPLGPLELRVAESEADELEALKLYRDMNHLSLAGGITCEQVIRHVESTTVVLYYKHPEADAPICVTAATFSLRPPSTMMLRLLATHPRMTRKGFARLTVHFLKELCRALCKTQILVYTYPSSASFYKAQHFQHTNPHLQRADALAAAAAAAASGGGGDEVGRADACAPADAGGACSSAAAPVAPAHQLSREEAREARRVYSAQENEMICHIQPTLAHMLSVGVRHDGVGAHPYACTRRRVASATDQPAASAGPRARKGRDRRSGGRGGSAGTRGPATGLVTVEHRHDFGESIEVWREAVSPVYQTSDASSASGPTSPRGGGRGGEGDRDGDAPPPRRRRLSRAEYEVEDILGVRSHDGEVQYLIKWKGWATHHNTWEPRSNLNNLHEEIEAFERSLSDSRALNG
mmetsp:Transcript_8651/g.27434  ORF Transcript_8651/g.27434 Transcript_8651/m.27434 type:complete len:491 (+) Transcript_8651:62-1534(+)